MRYSRQSFIFLGPFAHFVEGIRTFGARRIRLKESDLLVHSMSIIGAMVKADQYQDGLVFTDMKRSQLALCCGA